MNPPGAREARVLRNTGFLLAAFLVQKPLSFLYFNFLAGAVGVGLLGKYTALHDLIPITLILIDFSLSVVLTREVAKRPERAQALLSNVIGVKILFALAVFAVGGAVIAFGPFGGLTQGLLFLVALIVALDSFTLTFYAVFRGLENMRFESWGVVVTQVVTLMLGVVLLKLGYGLTAAFLSILAGSTFNFAYAVIVLHRRAGLTPRPVWDRSTVATLLTYALPFAVTAVLAKLFIYTDRYILLAASHGQTFPVGVYATAHKWTYTFEFIPAAFAAALLPAMSAAFVHSKERLVYLFERSLHYLLVLGAPILVGIWLLSETILGAFLPREFQLSVAPLRILLFAIPAIFLNFPVGTLLNATNRQAFNTLSMGIAVLVNLILNVLLVGPLGYNGTAIATLVSTAVLFGLGLVWVARVIPIPWASVGRNLVRSTVAAAAMGLVLAVTRPYLPLAVLIAVGAAVYGLALIGVGAVNRADGRALLQAATGRGFGGA